jgi:hypothetical protein
MVYWNFGIALCRVPSMGDGQLNWITGCLGFTNSTRGLHGPDP